MKRLSIKYSLSLLFLSLGVVLLVLFAWLFQQEDKLWEDRSQLFLGIGILLVLFNTALVFIFSRRFENQLKEQNRQNRQLFEENPNPMWVFDKETLKFLAVNEAAIDQYGYSREEFLKMSILDIRPAEDTDKVKANVSSAPSGFYSTGVWRHIRKDGKQIQVKVSSHSISFKGHASEIILVNDVSKQVQYEEEREALLNSLLHQNHKLEEFAYIVSHQLRAPVANLLGLSQLFKMVGAGEVAEVIQKMNTSALRLDRAIKDVALLIEKRKDLSAPKEEVELEEILRQATAFMEHQIERSGASITYDFSSLPKFSSVRTYVQDIFNNLLTNAIKYRDPEKKVNIRLHSYKKDKRAIVCIEDNGLGLDLEKYGHTLGKPFTRFHFHVPGSGIGLSLVKTQLELLKGDIHFKSQEGQGMKVELSFPLQ